MRLHFTGLAVLIVLTLANNSLALEPMQRQIIVGWTRIMAQKYGVDENFALGVFNVESRKGSEEFRIGRVGKFYLPAGIHKDFLKRWPVNDLCTNIEVGVRALQGPQDKVLHRYNSSWSGSYAKAVKQAQRDYGRESK